jgi:hypothetical protein
MDKDNRKFFKVFGSLEIFKKDFFEFVIQNHKHCRIVSLDSEVYLIFKNTSLIVIFYFKSSKLSDIYYNYPQRIGHDQLQSAGSDVEGEFFVEQEIQAIMRLIYLWALKYACQN